MRTTRRQRFSLILRPVIAATIAMLAMCTVMAVSTHRTESFAVTDAASVSPAPTTLGIADSDLYFSYNDPTVVAKHLDETAALGVHDVRFAIPWAAIETTRGQYTWSGVDTMINAAAARGMGVLAVVTTTPDWARAANTSVYQPPTNPADFGTFMGVLAARYAAKVSAYEVWNEPNAALGWSPAPDPAGYTAMLKAAYPKIKAASSNAVVIGGVLGSAITWGTLTMNPVDFVTGMYAAGAAGNFDALSFHPYQNSTKFSQGASLGESPLNQVNAIRQRMVANGDSAKKIWATEYGLSTGQVSAQQQADYINDFVHTWHTLSYAGPAFVYTLVDRNSADTSDPESTFGLYSDAWVAKPGATVVRDYVASNA